MESRLAKLIDPINIVTTFAVLIGVAIVAVDRWNAPAVEPQPEPEPVIRPTEMHHVAAGLALDGDRVRWVNEFDIFRRTVAELPFPMGSNYQPWRARAGCLALGLDLPTANQLRRAVRGANRTWSWGRSYHLLPLSLRYFFDDLAYRGDVRLSLEHTGTREWVLEPTAPYGYALMEFTHDPRNLPTREPVFGLPYAVFASFRCVRSSEPFIWAARDVATHEEEYDFINRIPVLH